jgi:hypothetical protein
MAAVAKSPDIQKLRQHLDARLLGMRVDRYSWWIHWRELADYILPRRYKWLITPNQATRGSPINNRIVDSTGSIALRTLGAGMMSGMTSPARIWFTLGLHDEDLAEFPAVKGWLEEAAKRMRMVLAESNFYNAMAVLYVDLGCFGTAPLIIYEDFEDVIRCYNSCAGEYYLANGPRLDVDTFYREFVQSTIQVAKKFGVENCSPTIQNAVGAGGTRGAALTREVVIAHAIEPNDQLVAGAPGVKGMPYREVYWEWGQGEHMVLRIRGFHECPFIAPRWDINANDAYGRSPGMDALGDIKQLQVETKRKAQAIDKMVNPPMIADVSLKNEPASLLPGGVTYVQQITGGVGFKPVYEVKPEIGEMMEDIKEVQTRVKTTFFNDLFLMISQLDTVRTATEIDARREEKLIQLGPVLERFENEALDPAIDRVFAVMLRAKLFPPIPKELQGQNIKVEYVSMLAQAQKTVMSAGVERFAQFVGNLAGAKPEVLDKVDFDEMVDEYADFMGVSTKIVVPYAKVLQMRMQRAQAQAQQAAMQQTMAGVQGAQVLSKTDVGGGKNALQAMVGA